MKKIFKKQIIAPVRNREELSDYVAHLRYRQLRAEDPRDRTRNEMVRVNFYISSHDAIGVQYLIGRGLLAEGFRQIARRAVAEYLHNHPNVLKN